MGSTATHQAVLIAQEARAACVNVTEFPFTAASVGPIALSLHQAIRNHRIALPDDEVPAGRADQRQAAKEHARDLPA